MGLRYCYLFLLFTFSLEASFCPEDYPQWSRTFYLTDHSVLSVAPGRMSWTLGEGKADTEAQERNRLFYYVCATEEQTISLLMASGLYDPDATEASTPEEENGLFVLCNALR